jgi:hypothetical protein
MPARLAVLITSLIVAATLPVSVLADSDVTATDGLRVLISAPGRVQPGATFTVTVRLVNNADAPGRVLLTEWLTRFASPTDGTVVRTYQDPRLLAYTGQCGEFVCSTNYVSLDDIDPGLTVLFRYEVRILRPGPDGGATFAFGINRLDSLAVASSSKTVLVQEPGA